MKDFRDWAGLGKGAPNSDKLLSAFVIATFFAIVLFGGCLLAQEARGCSDLPEQTWKCSSGKNCNCTPASPLPVPQDPIVERSFQTGRISCWGTGKNEKIFASRIGRSRIYQSKTKRFNAFVTVLAAARGKYGEQNIDCGNHSVLFLAARSKPYEPIFVETRNEVVQGLVKPDGNSLRIVQWSPYSDKLLVESSRWAYETDSGFDNRPLIYDAEHKVIQEPDLGGPIRKEFINDCGFEVSIEGFSRREEIILTISPLTDEDGSTEGVNTCVKKRTRAIFDYKHAKLKIGGPGIVTFSNPR